MFTGEEDISHVIVSGGCSCQRARTIQLGMIKEWKGVLSLMSQFASIVSRPIWKNHEKGLSHLSEYIAKSVIYK